MATARDRAVKATMANISNDRRGSLPVSAKTRQPLVDEDKTRVSLQGRRHSEIQPSQLRSLRVNTNDHDVLLPDKARRLLGLQETTKERSVSNPIIGRSPSAPHSPANRYTKRKFFKRSDKLRRWLSNLHLTPEEELEDNVFESAPGNSNVPSIVIDSCSSDSEDCRKEDGAQKHAQFEEGLLSPFYTLDAAVASGDYKLLEAILCSGSVRPNALNASGGTAMHEAAFQGKLRCLRVFLKFGVDINIRDKEGWTPLHAAVCGGDVECVTFLLRHGARTDIETDEGVRPVQIALQSDDRRIVRAIAIANAERGVRQDRVRRKLKGQTTQQKAWENIYGPDCLHNPKNILPEKMIHERNNNKVAQDLELRNRLKSMSPHMVYF